MSEYEKFNNHNISKTQELFNRIKNGRVDISGNNTSSTDYPLYLESNRGDALYKAQALKSIQTSSKISDLFFSVNNIDLLHNIMFREIWKQSDNKYKISRQSDNELRLVMRSLFLQYGKNVDTGLKQQLGELNTLVLDYCINNIMSNIEMHISYTKRVSELPQPLEHPKNLSITGTKG